MKIYYEYNDLFCGIRLICTSKMPFLNRQLVIASIVYDFERSKNYTRLCSFCSPLDANLYVFFSVHEHVVSSRVFFTYIYHNILYIIGRSFQSLTSLAYKVCRYIHCLLMSVDKYPALIENPIKIVLRDLCLV